MSNDWKPKPMRYRFTLKSDLPATAPSPPIDMRIVKAQCTVDSLVYESDICPDSEIVVWLHDTEESRWEMNG